MMTECYEPSGCCITSNISLEEFLCQTRQLLPPAQFWGNDGSESTRAFVDSVLSTVHKALEYINKVYKELDPCTAEFTVETWAKRYGIDVTCNDVLPYCSSQLSGEQRQLVLSMLICLHERIKFTRVINLQALTSIGELFGVKIRVFQPGIVISPDDERCAPACGGAFCDDCEPVTWVEPDCNIKYPLSIRQPDDHPFYTSIEPGYCDLSNGSAMYTHADCAKMPPVLVFRLCPFDEPDSVLDCNNWMTFPRPELTETFSAFTVCSPAGDPVIRRPLFDAFACFIKKAFPPNYTVCVEVADCDDCEVGSC